MVKKDEIIAIAIGAKGWDYTDEPPRFFGKSKIKEALKILDFDFDGGYGGENGYAVYVWTKDWIIIKGTYDGSEWYDKIPRNPNKKIKPSSIGGG